MRKIKVKAIKCKNYDGHMVELEKNPLSSTPLFIRESNAINEGWVKKNGQWLCPDCVKAAGNWGLRGDMV